MYYRNKSAIKSVKKPARLVGAGNEVYLSLYQFNTSTDTTTKQLGLLSLTYISP